MSETDRKIIIAGGSGFLGISLANHLAGIGCDPIILTRGTKRVAGPWQYVAWDGRTLDDWVDSLNGAFGIVNLAGRTVDCIKTPDHQDEILRSRVESTRVLGQAIRQIENPPTVWVQMSTAHIYGDPPVVTCDESAPFGVGLAPNVAMAWEAEFVKEVLDSQRGVVLRTGFVIGRDRGGGPGALGKLGWLTRIGLGGTVGSGKQGMSWIHELDMNRLFERALFNESMQGTYNSTGPNPVSQKEFMAAMRKALGMPIGLPAAEWMVRIGAHLLLRTDPELALYGRYVLPQRLADEGFEFRYPMLKEALAEIYS